MMLSSISTASRMIDGVVETGGITPNPSASTNQVCGANALSPNASIS
jgi:hypothetical protein